MSRRTDNAHILAKELKTPVQGFCYAREMNKADWHVRYRIQYKKSFLVAMRASLSRTWDFSKLVTAFEAQTAAIFMKYTSFREPTKKQKVKNKKKQRHQPVPTYCSTGDDCVEMYNWKNTNCPATCHHKV